MPRLDILTSDLGMVRKKPSYVSDKTDVSLLAKANVDYFAEIYKEA